MLKSNVVESASAIELPKEWRGELDLTGSQFLGTLEFRRSTGSSPVPRIDRHRGQPSPRPERFCPPKTASPDDAVDIDLTGVNVRMLAWHLPLTCDYRWQGAGLRYEVWEAPRSEWDDAESPLQRWRKLLADPRADELHTISNYLDRYGILNDSRDISEEAKRVELLPNCTPDAWLVPCLWVSDWFSRQTFWAVYLAPVGYGTKPMMAVGPIVILWFVPGLIYSLYAWWHKSRNTRTMSGFIVSDEHRSPEQLSMFRYSMDIMVPLAGLRAYARMRPTSWTMWFVVWIQIVLGWWLVTAFLQTVVVP